MAQPNARNQLERLTELMGEMVIRGRVEKFKPPKYDGTGDVDYFLKQFNDCRDANQWNNGASLLHLRSYLEKDATKCGRGDTVDEVEENLRARFSLTVRQARDRLGNVRREPGQSLHQLGDEVERLVRLSYPDMAAADRVTLSIDALKRSLDNKGLNRHLLAVPCNTVKAVVRAAEEYFQACGTNVGPTRPRLNALVEEEPPQKPQASPPAELQQLMQIVDRNSRLLNQLATNQLGAATNNWRTPPPNSGQNTGCFKCGAIDHWKRDCPNRAQRGNDRGSQ